LISVKPEQGIYCHPLRSSVLVDGYDDEWLDVAWSSCEGAACDNKVQYRCGVFNDELALFFRVHDTQLITNNPQRPQVSNGDRVVLTTGAENDYVFNVVGHGPAPARYLNQRRRVVIDASIDAFFTSRPEGYQLELKLPLTAAAGKLNFQVVDETSQGLSHYSRGLDPKQLPWFTYRAATVERALAVYEQAGIRLRLVDENASLTGIVGDLKVTQPSSEFWMLSELYRLLLSGQDEGLPTYLEGVNYGSRVEVANALSGALLSQRYRSSESSAHNILASAAPILRDGRVVGVIVAEQSSEQTAALTDKAFSRLLGLSFTIIFATVLVLVGYASFLSWRIHNLSRATQTALDNPYNIGGDFPHSEAADEIGVLTRNYAELMRRIAEYTSYLQTLSRKLSHELRTPLAIIHSSLDNLAYQSLDEKSQTYQQRAKDGALRLGNILTSMSEARRVEESIEYAELEQVNVAELVWEMIHAYRDLHTGHKVTAGGELIESIGSPEYYLQAVPDLLVQMLDKLVDNASEFCPAGGVIDIRLDRLSSGLLLSVSNEGPLLPETMRHQLFDNLVSLRDESEEGMHLGLGLHIVSLIVEYHQGRVDARNNEDQSGVTFSVFLPAHSLDD